MISHLNHSLSVSAKESVNEFQTWLPIIFYFCGHKTIEQTFDNKILNFLPLAHICKLAVCRGSVLGMIVFSVMCNLLTILLFYLLSQGLQVENRSLLKPCTKQEKRCVVPEKYK